MPRGDRRLSESRVYHVIIRGKEWINLFKDFSKMDSEDMFIDVLEEIVSKKTSIRNGDQARIFVKTYLRKRHIEKEALKSEKRFERINCPTKESVRYVS